MTDREFKLLVQKYRFFQKRIDDATDAMSSVLSPAMLKQFKRITKQIDDELKRFNDEREPPFKNHN